MLGVATLLTAVARGQRCSAQAALAADMETQITRLIDGETTAVPLGVPAQPSVGAVFPAVCGSAHPNPRTDPRPRPILFVGDGKVSHRPIRF